MDRLSLLALTIALSTFSIANTAVAQFRNWGSEGTIIGRVFIDRNGDGEKQANEPGIANAAIFTDDGLRVVTDEYGRFTIPSVQPGYRSAALDLKSIPGYQIATNSRLSDRNSTARIVRVSPGSLARMNFAVSPIAPERGNSRSREIKVRHRSRID